MNHISIIGRLVHDPELRATLNGTAVCHIRIARNEKHGEKEKSVFVDVTAWGKLGETIAAHKKQGDQVAVSGRLDYSEYTTNEGQKRSKLSITAESIEFLARKNGNGKDEHASTDTRAHNNSKAAEVVEEVIPF